MTLSSTEPPTLDPAPAGPRTWSVGTLTYNSRTLVNVFFWMLWGDFCLMLMDSGVAPNLLTIQLSKQGASNAKIMFVSGTITQILQMAMVPFVSTWSDRHRGPLGRRMPFMLYSTPFIALFLIGLGFSPTMAQWMHAAMPHTFGVFSVASLSIALITIFNTCYCFFDTFPQSVYYYLWTDVIPEKLMGTFACLFRVCSTMGVFVFNRFLLKHCDDHPGAVCVGAGALYMVTFLFLCLMVKEGDYPPPEPRVGSRTDRLIESIAIYLRECYSHAFYWKIYLYNLFFMVGFVPCQKLLILYADRDLHISREKFGNIMSWRDLVQIAIFFVLGPIVDFFHPLRAGFVGYALLLISAAMSFAFIHGPTSFAICVIGNFVAVAIYQGAIGALGPRLLPKEKYGQFCSALSMVWHLGLAIGVLACGKFIDVVGSYRWIFAWFFAFSALGMVMMWMVYQDWKKLGGDENYQPPGTRISTH